MSRKSSKSESANTLSAQAFGENDIVVFLAGLSGSGKSTFVNTLLASESMKVNHGLANSPLEIIYKPVDVFWESCAKGRRLLLVELPGFNRTFESDKVVLQYSLRWVQSQCINALFGGVIYFYDISQSRSCFPNRLEMERLRKVVDAGTKNLTGPWGCLSLVATKWVDGARENSEKRFLELRENTWATFSQKGSRICRFMKTPEDAQNILDALIKNSLYNHPTNQPQLDFHSLVKNYAALLNDSRKAGINLESGLRFFASLFRRKK